VHLVKITSNALVTLAAAKEYCFQEPFNKHWYRNDFQFETSRLDHT